MAAIPPQQALQRLRNLYRDAFKVAPASDDILIAWAKAPELWATQQIAHRNWSFMATEAVVRQCRILRKRAELAAAMQEAA
jgi:hypothetical protein